MAGRGKGRGKGFSFDIQNLGVNLNEEILQITSPPALFCPLISQPQPLCENERVNSRAQILKKLLERQNDDPYGINVATKALQKKDVERYSEIFKPKSCNTYKWDKRLFPEELFGEKPKRKGDLKPNTPKKKLKADETDVSKKLEKLEEKDDPAAGEQNKDDEDQDSEHGSDIMNDDDDLDDDELLEESADYVSSYFDNGEGYLEEEENLDGDEI